MTTIALYNAHWETLGGGEKYLCALAEAIAGIPGTRVELLIDRPSPTREFLETYFNVRLDAVTPVVLRRSDVASHLRRADVAVVNSNVRPWGTASATNVRILQMPHPSLRLPEIARRAWMQGPREAVKDLLRHRLITEARRCDLVLVYSEFVRAALERLHKLHATVLHPPIDDFRLERPGDRSLSILSVGRIFTGLYNDKRYELLITAFKELCRVLGPGPWQYHIAGSCADDRGSQGTLTRLRDAARGYPVVFHVNASYDELRRLYNEASVFWHGAGYGVDELHAPHATEHFGMSTVEAMSAGVVPVVVDRGGQKEIVSHGKSGYLWSEPRSLVAYTATLLKHPASLAPLAEEARRRFHDFDRVHFTTRARALFTPLVTDPHG